MATNGSTIEQADGKALASGTNLPARARLSDGDDAARAARLLAEKHPLLHGLLVPLLHRLRGYTTLYLGLTPHTPGAARARLRHPGRPRPGCLLSSSL